MFIRRSEVEAIRDELDGLRDDQDETDTWIESVMTKRIIVHSSDGHSLGGSLVAQMADGLILRAAELLNDDGSKTSMAGEVFVPRLKVAFAQLDE